MADSDEEFDDSDNEETKKPSKRKQKKTWIQDNEDNIIDFVDPTSAKNISCNLFFNYLFFTCLNNGFDWFILQYVSATKPTNLSGIASNKSKVKDHGFKTAPDGRLIIVDNSDDSEDEQKKKKKNKLSFLNSDSENDDGKLFIIWEFSNYMK